MSTFNIVNFDILPSLNLGCAFPEMDYINKLVLTTLAPIALCVLVILIQYTRKRSFRGAVNSSISTILKISFVVFITVSSVVFGFFKSDHFEDIDTSFLELDYSLDVRRCKPKKQV